MTSGKECWGYETGASSEERRESVGFSEIEEAEAVSSRRWFFCYFQSAVGFAGLFLRVSSLSSDWPLEKLSSTAKALRTSSSGTYVADLSFWYSKARALRTSSKAKNTRRNR